MPKLTAQIITSNGIKNLSADKPLDEMQRAAKEWLDEDVLTEAKKRAPKDTGALAGSLRVYTGKLVAGIRTDSRKAPYVHGRYADPSPPRRRTVPHFPPPNQSLRAWAKRHNIPLFLLQRAIARRGTPIIPFISEAVAAKKSGLDKRLDDAAKRIERDFN